MATYETTSGDIVITAPNCDCGLTGGCEKCWPYVIPKYIDCETFILPFNEQWEQQRLRVIDGQLFRVDKGSPPKV